MFTPETLAFIAENRERNDKNWFIKHKKEYMSLVRDPFFNLSQNLAPIMNEIDPLIITDPKNCVSRIYCDMRFSKNILYRDTLWISFRRDKKAFNGWPEFFFVLSPREFFYGCGYYSASSRVMETARRLIIQNHPIFLAALQAYKTQTTFIISGDKYKVSRYSNYNDELREWLERKTICFIYNPEDTRELFSYELTDKMKTAFLQMKPVYEFFVVAETLSESEKNI